MLLMFLFAFFIHYSPFMGFQRENWNLFYLNNIIFECESFCISFMRSHPKLSHIFFTTEFFFSTTILLKKKLTLSHRHTHLCENQVILEKIYLKLFKSSRFKWTQVWKKTQTLAKWSENMRNDFEKCFVDLFYVKGFQDKQFCNLVTILFDVGVLISL